MAGGRGVVLGYLKYVLGFDSLAYEKGLGDAEKRMKSAQRSLAKTADQIKSVGAVMSVGITAPFSALVATAIPAAKESAEALGQVQAALKGMGDASQRTLPQLQEQASALMHLSTFDDDDILRKVTANLLTFGKVSGEVFDRAQLAAVNLSARLGQDLQSSTIQIGKALNDPIKGVTALARVGVSFTAQQKEQIKAMAEAGNVAGAQKIILGELEKQFGGSAEALRKATPGIEAQQAWADFQEMVGGIALQALPPLTRALAGLLEWFNKLDPSVQTFIVGATAVAAVLGPVTLGIGGIVSVVGLALPAITAVGAAFATMGTVITASVIPAIGAVIAALSPILLPIAAVAAAVAGLYLAWRNWDKITAIVSGVYEGLKAWLGAKLGPIWEGLKARVSGAVTWFVDLHLRAMAAVQNLVNGIGQWMGAKLSAIWEGAKKGVYAMGEPFRWLYDKVVGHSWIPDMVDGIGKHMARLDQNMVSVAERATLKTADMFRKLDADVQPILDRLFPERARELQYKRDRATIADSGLSAADKAEAQGRLDKEHDAALKEEADRLAGALRSSSNAAKQAAKDALRDWKGVQETTKGIKVNFEDVAQTVAGAVASLAGLLRSDAPWWEKVLGAIQIGAEAYGRISGKRAMGGSVTGGRTYMVGERGPELFTAQRSGYIHSNAALSGGGRPVIVQIVGEEGAAFEPRVASISGATAGATVERVQRRALVRGRQALA